MSDELTGALRELAARHEAPPRIGAAEVRGRAGRRSRRRRATAALGTTAAAVCALTAVAFTLHTEEPGPHHRTPAAGSGTPARPPGTAAPAPAPASAGVLDLGRRTLTVGERVIRVDSRSFPRFAPGSRMKVVAKSTLKVLPLENGTRAGTEVKVPYLVQLSAPDRQPVYAGALAVDTKALAALSARSGWLGMNVADAKWFYARARAGDRIEITTTATARPATPDAVGGGGG
ncbi:hypothetical protein ACFW6C_10060 [Streptomyces fungicidicus]|uniref:hypothetical protein n=1 Tax=Streptomyces fungicidicus TaxID=68203 RepID=UPI0036B6EBFC